MSKVRFLGLDVHADTIAVAIAEPAGEVRSLGTIPNRPESIRMLVKKLGAAASLRVCYEAGPTGYVIYWQLTALGVRCDVVAPTLVPTKAGDRGEDRSPGCRKAGAELPRRRPHGGVGTGTRPTRPCETWCGRGKRPRRTSSVPVIAWVSFCCAMAGGPQRA